MAATNPHTTNGQQRAWVPINRAAHFEWAALARRHPSVSALLHILVAQVDAQGCARVTQKALAKELGVCVRTVSRHLAVLIKEGWVTSQLTGRGREKRYTITDQLVWQSVRAVPKRPTVALYRHFSDDDELLYVGVSKSAPARLAQHMNGSPWSRAIARVEIEHFPSRGEALEAERRAILDEMPLWNVVGKVREEAPKPPARKERPPFDAGNVPKGILETVAHLRQLKSMTETAKLRWEVEDKASIGLELTFLAPHPAEDLQSHLDALFHSVCEPSLGAGFGIVGSTTTHEPGTRVEATYLSLLTPYGLSRCCEESRDMCPQYAAIYESEVLPAIATYQEVFDDILDHVRPFNR